MEKYHNIELKNILLQEAYEGDGFEFKTDKIQISTYGNMFDFLPTNHYNTQRQLIKYNIDDTASQASVLWKFKPLIYAYGFDFDIYITKIFIAYAAEPEDDDADDITFQRMYTPENDNIGIEIETTINNSKSILPFHVEIYSGKKPMIKVLF